MTESQTDFPLPWLEGNWNRLILQLTQNRLAHAYLLCGEPGLGKRFFSMAAANLLLCENPTGKWACGNCRPCQLGGNLTSLDKDYQPDLLFIEPEEGSKVLKIEQIRAMINFTEKTSHGSGRKIVILSNADTLNHSAANALLKTLEEPPGKTVLFLISDSPGRLLPTIRSRCQRVLFTTPDTQTALQWLRHSIADRPDLAAILEQASGKPLLAKLFLEDGELTQRHQILRALCQVVDGTLDPLDFASAGRSTNPATIMECLWQTSIVIIKFLLCKDDALLTTPEIQAIVNRIPDEGKDRDNTLAKLLHLNQATDDARRQLTSSSNPNPQLIIESILWRWSRIAL